jgi:hypothetical protein
VAASEALLQKRLNNNAAEFSAWLGMRIKNEKSATTGYEFGSQRDVSKVSN